MTDVSRGGWFVIVAAAVVLVAAGLAMSALALLMGVGYCNEDIDLSIAEDCASVAPAWIGRLLVGGSGVAVGWFLLVRGTRRRRAILSGLGALLGAVAAWASWFWW